MTTIPRALLEQALKALEYHTQQTRPIQKTEHAILAIRAELAKPSATPAWHDAPEVAALKAERDALLSALHAMLTHMGMDEDEWNKPTFDQARAAIAKVEGGEA